MSKSADFTSVAVRLDNLEQKVDGIPKSGGGGGGSTADLDRLYGQALGPGWGDAGKPRAEWFTQFDVVEGSSLVSITYGLAGMADSDAFLRAFEVPFYEQFAGQTDVRWTLGPLSDTIFGSYNRVIPGHVEALRNAGTDLSTMVLGDRGGSAAWVATLTSGGLLGEGIAATALGTPSLAAALRAKSKSLLQSIYADLDELDEHLSAFPARSVHARLKELEELLEWADLVDTALAQHASRLAALEAR